VRHHVYRKSYIDALLTSIRAYDLAQSHMHPVKRLNVCESVVLWLNTRLIGSLGFPMLLSGDGVIVEDLVEPPLGKSGKIWLERGFVVENVPRNLLNGTPKASAVYK